MEIDQIKEKVCSVIEEHADDIMGHAKWLAENPELGFREKKSSKYIDDELHKLGFETETGLAVTGVKAYLKGKGAKGPNVAVLGEMDALICNSHPTADPETGAAHACGHNVQVASMLGVATGLSLAGILPEIGGNVTFFAVPAEEYIEIDKRMRMRDTGEIHFLGGKQELIYRGCFDDVEMAMMIHTEGNKPEPSIAVGETSNGFIGKTIRYIGKEAHAAASPHEGINALNAAMLGLMGIHALRETFIDEDHIRVHPIITRGGDTVNNVPADVRLETYVRAKTMESIEATHLKVDRALRAGGDAIGAETHIRTIPGYLPLVCSKDLNALFMDNSRQIFPEGATSNSGHFAASTDMGDLSHLIPCIHPFVGGTEGSLHSEDFKVKDPYAAIIMPAKAMAMTLVDILANGAERGNGIISQFKPVMSRTEYIRKLDGYFS